MSKHYRVGEEMRRVRKCITIPKYLCDLLEKCSNQSRIVEEALKKELKPDQNPQRWNND